MIPAVVVCPSQPCQKMQATYAQPNTRGCYQTGGHRCAGGSSNRHAVRLRVSNDATWITSWSALQPLDLSKPHDLNIYDLVESQRNAPDFALERERCDGVSEHSEEVLNRLFRHCERPEFQCRFRWQPGSMALWDNRATLHYAVADYWPARRVMHRVTIETDAIGDTSALRSRWSGGVENND